jgi:hypothetical protein
MFGGSTLPRPLWRSGEVVMRPHTGALSTFEGRGTSQSGPTPPLPR